MKTFEQLREEQLEYKQLEEGPKKWAGQLLKGLGRAIVPAGAALGSGIVKTAAGLVGRAINPKDKSAKVVAGKEGKGPRTSN